MESFKRVMGVLLCVTMLLGSFPAVFAEDSANAMVDTSQHNSPEEKTTEPSQTLAVTEGLPAEESFQPYEDSPNEGTTKITDTVSGTCGENMTWTLDQAGLLTITGIGEMQYYDSGDTTWEKYKESITAVVIGEGITNIDYIAFYGCTNLTKAVIPSTVTTIEAGAFYNCGSLREIHFPEGLTGIEHNAFVKCTSLTEIVIPAGITTVTEQCFYGCSSVTKIILPEGLTTIEDGAFGRCSAVATVELPKKLTTLGACAFEFCESLKEIVIPASISTIETYLFVGCSSLENVVLPEGVSVIEDNAFAECIGLREITLPNTVTTLGMGAFWHCASLEKVTLSSGTATVGYGAFYDCDSLKEIRLPASVTEVAGGAFLKCSNLTAIWVDIGNPCYGNGADGVLFNKNRTLLHTHPEGLQGPYTVPEGVESIGDYAFAANQNLTGIDFPDSVTSIGEYAFVSCDQLTQIRLPKRLQAIGREAFSSCNGLTEIEIPGGVDTIENMAFYRCSNLEKAVLREGVKTIGTEAFQYNEKLKEIQLPSTLTTIREYAFSYCVGLTEIVIPRNIALLERFIFEYCKNLRTVTFAGHAPTFEKNALSPSLYDSFKAVAYYPAIELSWTDEAITGHGCISEWIPYLEITEDYLDHGTFGEELTWAIRKDGMLVICGKGSMGQCKGDALPWKAYKDRVLSVMVTRGVTDVCDYAFADCGKLTRVTLNNTVTEIGAYAFSGCKALNELQMSEKVYRFGDGAFRDCASLPEIAVPASVTDIGNGVFVGCGSLTGIRVDSQNSVFASDADGALLNHAETELLAVPAGLTGTYDVQAGVVVINDYAFAGCGKELQITFPMSAPAFGENAFYQAESVVYYPVENTTWTGDVMQKYGGDITWIPYDSSIVLGADVALHQKTEQLTVMIQAKKRKGQINGNEIKPLVQNITVSSILGEQMDADGIFSIVQNEAAQREIVLKKKNYQDYIIPTNVSASLAAVLADKEGQDKIQYPLVAYMKQDDKSGKPYISTVFGRESNVGAPYKELQNNQLNLEEGSRHDIIISAVGIGRENAMYYIAQDAEHCVSSRTGVFTYTDLYKALDYGKTTYAYAVTGEGVSTEPVKLNITKMAARSEELVSFLKRSSISLLGSDGNIVVEIPEEFPLVGGGKLDLSAFESPIGIHVSGSSVKISLGVDIFSRVKEYDGSWKKPSEKEKEETYIKFKKDFCQLSAEGDIGDALEELDLYKTFMDKYSNDYSGYYEKKRNFDVEFLGYLEATVVNGQLVVKEILVNVKGEFLFRYTQQGAIWVIPAYYYVEAGAEIGLTGKTAQFLPGLEMPKIGIALDIEPKLAVGGGAGVKNAVSAGLRGEGSLPIMLDFTEDHLKVDMKGAFKAEGEFFILKGDVTLLSGEMNLIDWYYGSKAETARVLMGDASDGTPAAAIVSRDYGSETSGWQGEIPQPQAQSAEGSGAAFHTLQANVFNRSQPQVAVCGDGLIMVWVEDDATRDTYNRMRLVYSVYDAERKVWSDPAPVFDDGHNDAYPSLVSDGYEIYVAWQKIDQTLTAENCTGTDVLLRNSELFLAKFDMETAAFGEASQLTDNDLYEYGAVVALEKGEAVVYYASVDGSQIQEAKAHTLYRYSDKARALATKKNYIVSIATGEGKVSYAMDVDGDLSTASDIGVYTVNTFFTSTFKKTDTDGAFTYASYAQFNGENTLFVSDMYNIYYMESGKRKTVLDASHSISGDITFVQGDFGPRIIWTEMEATGSALYMVSYEADAWTKPVKLAQLELGARDVDIVSLYGELLGACNTDTPQGSTDLNFFELRDFTDLKVLDYLYFDEHSAIVGWEMPLDVAVKNLGTTRIGNVCFTVADGIGPEQVVWAYLDLPAGQAKNVTLRYLVPENYAGTTLRITAEVYGVQEVNTDNNTVSAEIGKPDLTVKQMDVHVFDDGYILNVNVENNSLVEAKDVTLTVARDENGHDPIYTQAVGTVTRNTYASVSVSLPADQLNPDALGAAKVYLFAESASGEAASADNKLCVVIYVPEETPCEHTVVETVAGQSPDCTNGGYMAYTQCKFCGQLLEGKEKLPPLGHDWREATCQSPKTCDRCGLEEGEPASHSYQNGKCQMCGKLSEDVLPGDVDRDGRLSYKDALKILRHSIGLEELEDTFLADVNGDNAINYKDALIVLRRSIGLE